MEWSVGNGESRVKITEWKMRHKYGEMGKKLEKGKMMRIEE